MSALKEHAKRLVDLLPEDALRVLLEDLEDALDLDQAIAEADLGGAVELRAFLHGLDAARRSGGE